jgi:hypothetical protein
LFTISFNVFLLCDQREQKASKFVELIFVRQEHRSP